MCLAALGVLLNQIGKAQTAYSLAESKPLADWFKALEEGNLIAAREAMLRFGQELDTADIRLHPLSTISASIALEWWYDEAVNNVQDFVAKQQLVPVQVMVTKKYIDVQIVDPEKHAAYSQTLATVLVKLLEAILTGNTSDAKPLLLAFLLLSTAPDSVAGTKTTVYTYQVPEIHYLPPPEEPPSR